MSFVRAKEIPPHSGNWYDYEVKCILENGHPRQKVIQYLGKHGSDYSGRLIGATGRHNQSSTEKVNAPKIAKNGESKTERKHANSKTQ